MSRQQNQPVYEELRRLTRDGTVEPVSRDQILRRERGQTIFPCSADHQDWETYPVAPYSSIINRRDDHQQ